MNGISATYNLSKWRGDGQGGKGVKAKARRECMCVCVKGERNVSVEKKMGGE